MLNREQMPCAMFLRRFYFLQSYCSLLFTYILYIDPIRDCVLYPKRFWICVGVILNKQQLQKKITNEMEQIAKKWRLSIALLKQFLFQIFSSFIILVNPAIKSMRRTRFTFSFCIDKSTKVKRYSNRSDWNVWMYRRVSVCTRARCTNSTERGSTFSV